jgi:hypothetical protein
MYDPDQTLVLSYVYTTPEQDARNDAQPFGLDYLDRVEYSSDRYYLTTDHSASSYGQPVLLDAEGEPCHAPTGGNWHLNGEGLRTENTEWLRLLGTNWTQATGG